MVYPYRTSSDFLTLMSPSRTSGDSGEEVQTLRDYDTLEALLHVQDSLELVLCIDSNLAIPSDKGFSTSGERPRRIPGSTADSREHDDSASGNAASMKKEVPDRPLTTLEPVETYQQ
jgi:hypothetical protein